MKATRFVIEGNDVKLPSHVDLVEGLTEKIDTQINAYDSTTVTTRLNSLSDIYLGKTEKAADSSNADSCTTAYSATYDRSGELPLKAIHEKYYKKTETVDQAAADEFGVNISQKYAKKDGNYDDMSVGYAKEASISTYATFDGLNGNNIQKSYIKGASANGQTVTFQRGDNSEFNITTKDTTYDVVNASNSGLMTPSMMNKLAALSTDTSQAQVAHASTADKLKSARKIQISGGASGSANFDGSSDVTITLSSLNASSITGGTLAAARGGTGQTNLDNVTVGKAKAFDANRTISLSGAVSGSSNWTGGDNLTVVTNNIDVSKVTAGVLPTLNGGTGRTDGFAQGLAKETYINGFSFNGTTDRLFAGMCETSSNLAAKYVSIPGFKLVENAVVSVVFRWPNTAANPTLNVSGTGAKEIDSPISHPYSDPRVWSNINWQPISFCYTNNKWVIITPSVWKLAAGRTFQIAGAVTANAVTFDGGENVTLNAGAMNFNNATSITGALPITNGGTGQTDGTVAKLHTARNINGQLFDGSANVNFTCQCTTAGDVAAKVVTTANPYELVNGSVVLVTFNEKNTAQNPTLSINGSTPLPIRRGTTNVNEITRHNNQSVWLLNYGNAYWRIIDDPMPHSISLTGGVTGTATTNWSGDYTINCTVNEQPLYQKEAVPAKNYAGYESSSNSTSLNLFTTPGLYYLGYESADRGYWNHKPANMPIEGHFLIVYVNTTDNVVCQTLLSRISGVCWRRSYYRQWREWRYFAGEVVETVSL